MLIRLNSIFIFLGAVTSLKFGQEKSASLVDFI
jgi:hypothetical protein